MDNWKKIKPSAQKGDDRGGLSHPKQSGLETVGGLEPALPPNSYQVA